MHTTIRVLAVLLTFLGAAACTTDTEEPTDVVDERSGPEESSNTAETPADTKSGTRGSLPEVEVDTVKPRPNNPIWADF